MSYVHTLLDNYPPVRTSGQPWTKAVIFEGSTASGPWVQVHDTGNFADPDADPTKPKARSFEFATEIEVAWYLIKFFDAANNEASLKPIFYGPSFRPTVKDVANHILSRTKTPGGHYKGAFDNETSVKPEWVEEFIDHALSKVIMKMGTDLSAEEQDFAAGMAAIGAAMQVEISFYSEQIDNERSPYRELKQQWDDFFEDDEVDVPMGEAGGATNSPAYSFPATVPYRW